MLEIARLKLFLCKTEKEDVLASESLTALIDKPSVVELAGVSSVKNSIHTHSRDGRMLAVLD